MSKQSADTGESAPVDEYESVGDLSAIGLPLVTRCWRALCGIERTLQPYAYPAGIVTLKYGIAFIFLYFGAGKIAFALSGMALPPVVSGTANAVPFFPDPPTFTILVGLWEVGIGLCFVIPQGIRVAIAQTLILHQPATFVPFVVAPELMFSVFPVLPTFSGLYVLKNFAIIGGALILWHEINLSTPTVVGR